MISIVKFLLYWCSRIKMEYQGLSNEAILHHIPSSHLSAMGFQSSKALDVHRFCLNLALILLKWSNWMDVLHCFWALSNELYSRTSKFRLKVHWLWVTSWGWWGEGSGQSPKSTSLTNISHTTIYTVICMKVANCIAQRYRKKRRTLDMRTMNIGGMFPSGEQYQMFLCLR